MALGGGKIGGAKRGRIKQGTSTDGGKFGDRPLKDEGGGGEGGGASEPPSDNRRYLDMSSGGAIAPSSPPPAPMTQQQLLDMDDNDGPPSEEAMRSLGPVEKQSKRKNRGEQGVSADGPMPLKMERGDMGGGTASRRLNPAQQAYASSLTGAGAPPPPSQRDGYGGGAWGGDQGGGGGGQQSGPNTMSSDVSIINHTDVSLRMIAVDTAGSGQRVERQLAAKSSDSFLAPIGCTISIVHPVTQKAVFRYKVTDASTTLAVTDAALNGAADVYDMNGRLVGSSGRWYDNRMFVAAAGAGVVCGILLVAALIALLVRYLVKNQKMKMRAGFGGGGGGASTALGAAPKSGWQLFR